MSSQQTRIAADAKASRAFKEILSNYEYPVSDDVRKINAHPIPRWEMGGETPFEILSTDPEQCTVSLSGCEFKWKPGTFTAESYDKVGLGWDGDNPWWEEWVAAQGYDARGGDVGGDDGNADAFFHLKVVDQNWQKLIDILDEWTAVYTEML